MKRIDIYEDILDDMEDIFSRQVNYKEFDNKTILITGAYGMLASELVSFFMYLNEKKKYTIKIIVAIRNEKKFIEKFGIHSKQDYVYIYKKDLCETIDIDMDVDYIIHAASLASPQYYETNPVDVLKPNTIGTYRLLEFARQRKIKGFLLFSTGDIYGKTDNISELTENNTGITDPLDIHSCYGESKRMAETMCKSYCTQYNVPTKIIRIFHTYGPTMDVEKDPRVFSSFIKNIINGENIVMHSDGLAKRSFCYITDAVSAYLKVLVDGNNAESYNICNTEQYITIKELANILVQIYPEKKLKAIFKERTDVYLESRISSDAVPSNNKVKALGCEIRISCEEGFKRIIDIFMKAERGEDN